MAKPGLLHFTPAERRGLAVLAVCLLGIALGVAFYGRFVSGPRVAPVPMPVLAPNAGGSTLPTPAPGNAAAWPADAQADAQMPARFAPHPFDPNQASAADLLAMGIAPDAVRGWLRYRAAGGTFRQPADLLKLRSLPPDVAEALLPFVALPGGGSGPARHPAGYPPYPTRNTNAGSYGANGYGANGYGANGYGANGYGGGAYSGSRSPTDTTARNPALAYPKPYWEKTRPGTIDLNTADSAALEALPGIGAVTAMRIVQYRRSLGGFVSLAQLGEVFGMDSLRYVELVRWFRLGAVAAPHLGLNINTATEAQLRAHPYVRYRAARALVNYRTQHGPYSGPAQIREAYPFTDEQWARVAPYLRTE